jgi:hypothetical protein
LRILLSPDEGLHFAGLKSLHDALGGTPPSWGGLPKRERRAANASSTFYQPYRGNIDQLAVNPPGRKPSSVQGSCLEWMRQENPVFEANPNGEISQIPLPLFLRKGGAVKEPPLWPRLG